MPSKIFLQQHNPFHNSEGGKNFPPTSFTNIGMSAKNLLTFSFNPFVTLMRNFKAMPIAIPKLLNLN